MSAPSRSAHTAAARLRLTVAAIVLACLYAPLGFASSAAADEHGEPTITTPTTTGTTSTTSSTSSTSTTETSITVPVDQTTTTIDDDRTTTSTRRTTTTRGATATTAEDEPSTTTTEATTTTARNLLVAGDGTDGAESTTTSSTVVTVSSDSGLSEENLVWLIVAGLVLIAFLIGVWTVRFWKATQPDGGASRARPEDLDQARRSVFRNT